MEFKCRERALFICGNFDLSFRAKNKGDVDKNVFRAFRIFFLNRNRCALMDVAEFISWGPSLRVRKTRRILGTLHQCRFSISCLI